MTITIIGDHVITVSVLMTLLSARLINIVAQDPIPAYDVGSI